jgi:tRNA threonylcarbamoyladenosine biosynthesis protein TsaB
MILVIDTAKDEVRIGLVLDKKVEQKSWLGGRESSEKILPEIDKLFKKVGQKFDRTSGIIVNAGPGSFTGLRIGISIANTWAYALDIPIAGIDHVKDFDELIEKGTQIIKGKTAFEKSIEPVYGAEPNITKPKK